MIITYHHSVCYNIVVFFSTPSGYVVRICPTTQCACRKRRLNSLGLPPQREGDQSCTPPPPPHPPAMHEVQPMRGELPTPSSCVGQCYSGEHEREFKSVRQCRQPLKLHSSSLHYSQNVDLGWIITVKPKKNPISLSMWVSEMEWGGRGQQWTITT